MQYLLALTYFVFIEFYLYFNQSWRARDCRCAPWSVPKNGETLRRRSGLFLPPDFLF